MVHFPFQYIYLCNSPFLFLSFQSNPKVKVEMDGERWGGGTMFIEMNFCWLWWYFCVGWVWVSCRPWITWTKKNIHWPMDGMDVDGSILAIILSSTISIFALHFHFSIQTILTPLSKFIHVLIKFKCPLVWIWEN